MKKKTRNVNFYELTAFTTAVGNLDIDPTQTEFQLIISNLKSFFKKGTLFGSGASLFELVDLKMDGENLFFLVNKVNPDLPDIGFYSTKTSIRRTPTRATDEHREQSAHIMIEPRQKSNSARLKITTGAGINADKIKKIFSDTYEKNKNNKKLTRLRTRPWPTQSEGEDGKPRQYQINHRFVISIEPSEILTDILDNNKVVELDLIDTNDMSFDGTNLTLSKRTFTVTGEIPKSYKGLREILQQAKNGQHNLTVDQLRIAYIEEETDEELKARLKKHKDSKEVLDSRKSVKRFKTISASDLEKAFTRSDKIHLASDHSETQVDLSHEIMSELKLL